MGAILRPIAHDDLDDARALLTNPAVYRYLADNVEPDRETVAGLIKASLADAESDGLGMWRLSVEGGPSIAGLVSLANFEHGAVQLTYALHPDVWHSGLATRMAHTALGMAFADDRIRCVWAGADEPNTASIAVMRRLGMTFRRRVAYLLGPGLEYAIERAAFVRNRHAPLPVAE